MVSQSMMAPTPTPDDLPRRFSDFETLGEALDYAATGRRGLNFHDARGNLARAYPFSELRADAIACAHRLIAHGVNPEDRVALVAETGAGFPQLFFRSVYAAGWPVPLDGTRGVEGTSGLGRGDLRGIRIKKKKKHL